MPPTTPSRILLYGDTLRLAVVERQLRAQPHLQVTHIDPAHATAQEQLAVMEAGVLIYDTLAVDPDVIQAIHTLHPRVVTLGLGDGGGSLSLMGQALPTTMAAGLGRVLAVINNPAFG